jgi:hypothetical protein
MNSAFMLLANVSFLLVVLAILVLVSRKNSPSKRETSQIREDILKIREQIEFNGS